jgi:acylphosphatase
MMQKHISIKVRGRVQGVFFRASTREVAVTLGLKGFVRNEPDGAVYIEVEGEESILEEFTTWCKRGPRMAHVDGVEVTEGAWQEFKDFVIRH